MCMCVCLGVGEWVCVCVCRGLRVRGRERRGSFFRSLVGGGEIGLGRGRERESGYRVREGVLKVSRFLKIYVGFSF